MIIQEEIRQLNLDTSSLLSIAAFYRKMMKEFNIQARGAVGPPNYAMTLYFQSHLEDEAEFYSRVANVLGERITELQGGKD